MFLILTAFLTIPWVETAQEFPESIRQEPADSPANKFLRLEVRRYWGVESGGPSMLCQIPAIGEELGLRPEQVHQIKMSHEQRRIARGKSLALQVRLEKTGEIETIEGQQAVQNVIKTISPDDNARVREILDEDQFKRLMEIALQVTGPIATNWPTIQASLKLTEPQIEQVKTIAEAYRAARIQVEALRIRKLRHGDRADQVVSDGVRFDEIVEPVLNQATKDEIAAIEARLVSMEEQAVKRVAAVLTRSQRSRFDAMLGEPFDLERLMPAYLLPKPGDPEPDSTDRQAAADPKARVSTSREPGGR